MYEWIAWGIIDILTKEPCDVIFLSINYFKNSMMNLLYVANRSLLRIEIFQLECYWSFSIIHSFNPLLLSCNSVPIEELSHRRNPHHENRLHTPMMGLVMRQPTMQTLWSTSCATRPSCILMWPPWSRLKKAKSFIPLSSEYCSDLYKRITSTRIERELQ